MRIALIHYHLTRGGVSSVIRQQARSLLEAGDEVLVIVGEIDDSKSESPKMADRRPAGLSADFEGIPIAVVPDLRYDSRRDNAEAAAEEACERLASAVLFAMERQWGGPSDVLHVHNPLIRRNRLMLPMLRLLKDRGVKMLLQNHDFAEDFRPDVYHPGPSYIDDAHYAAVNGRDYSFLHRAGLDSLGTHLLPNAVVPLSAAEGLPRTRYLYPVRALRRKNLGEALLLSMFIPPGRTVAVTLPPLSSRDAPAYGHWRELAASLKLPVEFEVGEHASMSELLGSSFCAITTSVKEGFGFPFLEPWTAGRAVVGRRVDYVCSDFEAAGIRFDSFYDALWIPMVYLPAPLLRHKLEAALSLAYRAYDVAPPAYALKALTDDLFSRDSFDFGRLDEELQTELLVTLASNPAARADIVDANPFLAALPSWEPDDSAIAANRDRILASYAPQSAASRLRETYRSVVDLPVRHRLSKTVLLDLFLDPLKFSLVGMGLD